VLLQIQVLCHVTLRRLVIATDISEGRNVFILKVKQPGKRSCDCFILETNTPLFLDILVCFYKSTQRNTTEGYNYLFNVGVSNINNNV
jgi:hypothetical protein